MPNVKAIKAAKLAGAGGSSSASSPRSSVFHSAEDETGNATLSMVDSDEGTRQRVTSRSSCANEIGFQKATFFSKDRTTLMVLEIHKSRLLSVWGGDRDY